MSAAMYMSQLSTTLPLMEVDHHQDHHHHRQGHFQAFTLPKDPPVLVPFVINSSCPSDSSLIYGSDYNLRQHQAMLETQHMIGGASSVFATPFPTVESIRDEMIERSSYDPYDIEKLQATSESVKTGKWITAPAAAKMRITRKTSDPGVRGAAKKPRRRAQQSYEDHNHSSSGSSMNQPLGVIRVCSDCNTTKTPLWRSGPCGPKSLCNACGIRQRKARRSMMASGVSTDGAKVGTTCDAATAHPKVKKEKRADADRSLPFKKRCKLVVQDHPAATAAAADDKATVKSAEVVVAVPTMDLVDSIGVNWGKSSAAAAACFRSSPAFAVQDEITDAAMLLMTLSCGLVRS